MLIAPRPGPGELGTIFMHFDLGHITPSYTPLPRGSTIPEGMDVCLGVCDDDSDCEFTGGVGRRVMFVVLFVVVTTPRTTRQPPERRTSGVLGFKREQKLSHARRQRDGRALPVRRLHVRALDAQGPSAASARPAPPPPSPAARARPPTPTP